MSSPQQNPEEKAKELVGKFRPLCWGGLNVEGAQWENAKEAALILVEEMLVACEIIDRHQSPLTVFDDNPKTWAQYWESVRESLKNM